MVYRVYVQKKRAFSYEAQSLKKEITEVLQIKNLQDLQIINRYDIENINKDTFEYTKKYIFSEPQVDNILEDLHTDCDYIFAIESLPGQFDQRANSAMQCIQLISQKEMPLVRYAKIFKLYGNLAKEDIEYIKSYIINPIETREASLEKYKTLKQTYKQAEDIKYIDNFLDFNQDDLLDFLKQNYLAMDIEDLKFCQKYFIKENRVPNIAEIKIIDTYWSDHCRHTTFLTNIDNVTFEDEYLNHIYEEYLSMRKDLNITSPINLMDIATIMTKSLKKAGKLKKLDSSKEINACTVKIDVNVEGQIQKWLLLFKNETHNHPTEIEPFGGASTCIGGAIRDPLSGRGYVYAGMRITGSASPLMAIKDTLKGKLPQRKIASASSDGYSSYGNQIGVCTGIVDEIYHDGYIAKHMELGAVLGAVLEENVVRKEPIPTDIIILLGGKTGRDGLGGATGSSKAHSEDSLYDCGAEVQKGNAPEERKIQRLFRNKDALALIKKCNDFGAGGASVAISELADGVEINLNNIPKKYEGLNSLELAISESQERMAVVVAKDDAEKFIKLAYNENIEASIVAVVTEEKRLIMKYNNKIVVNLSREFLNSNGATKHINIKTTKFENYEKQKVNNFIDGYKNLAEDLNICSKRGLLEKFDSTIGANTVLMPVGGKYQLTPIQAMVHKIPVLNNNTTTCSVMSWGYNPFIFEKNQFTGAYLAVVESVSKLIATGAMFKDIYLTFQEYFEKLGKDSKKWSKPFSALLGAFLAQKDLEIAAIGGKDSMSGSFENINVPPTLVSFAVTTEEVDNIISPEFKNINSNVILLKPIYKENGLPCPKSLKDNFNLVNKFIKEKVVIAAYTPTYGGIADAIMKMCFGNKIGFVYDKNISLEDMFSYMYGAFILEVDNNNSNNIDFGISLGKTTNAESISYKNDTILIKDILRKYEEKLEPVYKTKIDLKEEVDLISYNTKDRFTCRFKNTNPNVLIPVFFGTNCEYDIAKAYAKTNAKVEIFVINNLTPSSLSKSIEDFAKTLAKSQILFIPGGFSGGDEPDGSAKFITSFFRNFQIKEEITNLLEKREGLIGGICNGFQALIKLGLVPYGKIIDIDENCPTLTFNKIKRHQSKLVNTIICSNKSPWLANTKVGEVYTVPISHGEGRFVAKEDVIKELALKGQIATQYVDLAGKPTYNIDFNPNSSMYAIEGITSPDGRVFGKMGHSERIGYGLYKNYIGKYDMKMFESSVDYFK